MLTGVLLHVIEAPVPVDAAVSLRRGVRPAATEPRQHVEDRAVVLVDDVDDRSGAERAGVERLTA